MSLRRQHSSDDRRSGSATARFAIAEELLDPLRSIDFRRVDVALAVHAHLVKVVEFSRVAAIPAQPPQLLQIDPAQNVDGLIGVVSYIEATLRFVRGEVHGN